MIMAIVLCSLVRPFDVLDKEIVQVRIRLISIVCAGCHVSGLTRRYQLSRKKERKIISNPSPTNKQETLLSCAERYGSSIWGAEQTRIDAGELFLHGVL